MEKIISISEAFSMQPKCFEISTQEHYNKMKPYGNDVLNGICKEIKLETIEIGSKCGDAVEEIYYVGYNFDGKKIFQYIANTVNVHYQQYQK